MKKTMKGGKRGSQTNMKKMKGEENIGGEQQKEDGSICVINVKNEIKV